MEIEYNTYLPATPENVEKAKRARFLEGLATNEEQVAQPCDHICFYDRDDGYMYIERICIDCGVTMEMI